MHSTVANSTHKFFHASHVQPIETGWVTLQSELVIDSGTVLILLHVVNKPWD